MDPISIIEFNPGLDSDFKRLNQEWIEAFFRMEDKDSEILDNPRQYIIDKGGQILFLRHGQEIIGTVALVPVGEKLFELSKMAVDARYRGRGFGNRLLEAAIEKLRSLGAYRVILFSNRHLVSAIELYRKFGFYETPLRHAEYERADIQMEYIFGPIVKPPTWESYGFMLPGVNHDASHYMESIRCFADVAKAQLHTINEQYIHIGFSHKWAIIQHLQHLIQVEGLWCTRIKEVADCAPEMTAVPLFEPHQSIDIENSDQILQRLASARSRTFETISRIDLESKNFSIHPRFKIAVTAKDLLCFIHRHDLHHLTAIEYTYCTLKSNGNNVSR